MPVIHLNYVHGVPDPIPTTLQAVEQWQGKLEGYAYDINAIMSEEKSEAGLRKAEMEAQKVSDDQLSLRVTNTCTEYNVNTISTSRNASRYDHFIRV